MDDFTKFQVQAANNQLEQPFATATLKFDNGDHTFWEHLVVLKNLTGTYIGLHFMSCNTVVIDTTHGLIHFPHLRMYVKSTARGTSAKHQAVFIHETMTIPRKTAKTITAFVDLSSKRNTTRYCDSNGKIHGSSKFATIPFNVKKICQKYSS